MIKMDNTVKCTYLVFVNHNITKLVAQSMLNKMFRGPFEMPIVGSSDADFLLKHYKIGEDDIWRPK